MQFSSRLIAHRGWQRRYPENTLIAIEAAIHAGAKHVEVDIQLTADLVPMLCHDQNLLRVCGKDKNINTLTLADLNNTSAYEPKRLGDKFIDTPLSSLEELVSLAEANSEVTFYVEVKRQSLRTFGTETVWQAIQPILNTIEPHCFIISFDLAILHHCRKTGWTNVAPVLKKLEQLQSEELQKIKPDMIFCSTELIANKHTLNTINYPVALYEVDQHDEALLWFEQGAALIESFAVGELIEQFQENENG